VAIAIRIFIKVVLVILLGIIEITKRLKLDSKLSTHLTLHSAIDTLDSYPITLINIVYSRAIARALIVALAIERERVDRVKIYLHKMLEPKKLRVVDDLDTLHKARSIGIYLLIGWILTTAISIAHLGRDHTTNLLEIVLRTPEATTRQIYLLHSNTI
jgi:hypothetical protein